MGLSTPGGIQGFKTLLQCSAGYLFATVQAKDPETKEADSMVGSEDAGSCQRHLISNHF